MGTRDSSSAARSRSGTGDSSFGRSRLSTVHSSEPGGGTGAGKGRPKKEQEFNPFQTEDEQQVIVYPSIQSARVVVFFCPHPGGGG